jgi:hypothetical protein
MEETNADQQYATTQCLYNKNIRQLKTQNFQKSFQWQKHGLVAITLELTYFEGHFIE